MKFNGKILSVCALLAGATACYGITVQKETKAEVKVYNRTGGIIYGGIYLASATGKVMTSSNKEIKELNKYGFVKEEVSKPSKITNSYRLIFSTDGQPMIDKVAGKNPKNIVSRKIDPFSANAPSSYTVRRKNENKSEIDGAKDLKIDQDGKLEQSSV